MKRKSDKAKLITKIETLLREQLKKERGDRCEICGRSGGNIGLFHILPKGKYPSLRFAKENILLVHWYPAHYLWHHDYHYARKIEQKIKKLRGEDYEKRLKVLAKISPKLTMSYMNLLYEALKKEAK